MTKNSVYKEYLNTLPGPENITRQELSNGIIVLTKSNFHSPTLSIKGYLQSGSLFDPEDKLGLSYMVAFGLMTGTARHDFQSLYNEIESIGANLHFSAGTLATSFSAHCLSEDLTLMMRLISECLREPVFPKKDFYRQKNQLLTALAIRSQDTSSMADLLFDKIIYAGHPYQHPDEGYPETIQAIERNHLEDFYRLTYGPSHMVISIVGDVEPQSAIEIAEQSLGDWFNPNQQPLPGIPGVAPLKENTYQKVSIPGKFQADIVMGSLAPTRKSPDFYALQLGNNILGEFGMMGRLGQRVREEAGLAYYAYSALNIGTGPGTWEMVAGVNPENIDQTISLITDEVRRFTSEPVTEEELEDTQSFYLGRLPFLLESNNGVAASLINIERFNLGLDYFRKYPQLIESVTKIDVLEASRKYLNANRLAIAVAGP